MSGEGEGRGDGRRERGSERGDRGGRGGDRGGRGGGGGGGGRGGDRGGRGGGGGGGFGGGGRGGDRGGRGGGGFGGGGRGGEGRFRDGEGRPRDAEPRSREERPLEAQEGAVAQEPEVVEVQLEGVEGEAQPRREPSDAWVRPERGDRGDRGERRERRPVERVQATEQTAQEAKAWLDGLFAKMQLSVQAKAQPSEDGLSVDLSGPDARRVLDGLGQGHGYLLSALQTLVPLVVFRDGRGNVTVDAHGHRQRRVEGLGRLATYLGDKAVSSGRSITLLGMASFERKAIHAGLGEHPTARTESEGEGPLRRLKIR